MKRFIAALMFFTRLPLYRWFNPPTEEFKRAVDCWSLTGWLTGGLMAGVLWLAAQVLPMTAAVIIALASRLLLTGALHEDGLADFADGFGGGGNKERILAIMKDSHIGSYGVIMLIVYFLLTVALLSSLPLHLACMGIIAGDVWSKTCSANIINTLPYDRTAAQAKNRLVYDRMSTGAAIVSTLSGMISLLLLPAEYLPAAIAPGLTVAIMILYFNHKIGGYTGDCCGATFLLSELSFYLLLSIIYNLQ